MGSAKEAVIVIEEEEIQEGDHVETTDYYFDKIGKPIPILRDQTFPLFHLQSNHLPSRPLALSEIHRLIFVAHPSGFLVARTKDVMDAAIDIKEKGSTSSIQNLSLVDVPIGKVHILTLSADDSTLAVSVSAHFHFFNVHSLLNKDLKPSFSCSLTDSSSTVKDIQWRRRLDNSYLVLSNQGKLYLGALASGTPTLKHIMDNVDAVEWSVKGKFIAVARESVLSILSSKFKEMFSISLPFKSLIADSDDSCIVKVDSIRWVRNDSVIVGCFQQTADGKEDNYFLQVIRSKDVNITDTSSKPVVLSFSDLFSGLVDDIVPYGGGPYLSLNYLEQCGLAITANKKNTDQHIVLLGWSVEDEMSEIAVIDIERDTWLPRIELQDSGDDNLIMGLCVDKVSLYGKVKVDMGVEEQKELSPYCVLMCVTLEGKLVMFQVASVTGANIPPEVGSALQDEEEDTASLEPEGSDQSDLSSGSHEETLEEVALGLQLQHVSNKELNINKDGEIPTQKDLVRSDKNESSMTALVSEQISYEHDIPEKQEIKSLYGQQSAKLGQSSFKASFLEGPSYLGRDSSKTETQRFAGFGSGSAFSGNVSTDAPSLSSHKDLLNTVDLAKEPPRGIGSTALPGAPSPSWPSGKVNFSEVSGSRSPLSASTLIQGNMPDNINVHVGGANVPGDLGGKPFRLMDTAGESTSTNASVRPALNGEQRGSIVSGTIESLPTFQSSQLSCHEKFSSARSPIHRPQSLKDDYRASSLRSSEPNLSKQFGNIKELAKELDTLLECIEETGGFRDACTVFLRSSVEALEEGMGNLSENCRMLKNVMDERLGEIQHLLDKTVQVLARKIYVDGIVKQASDSQYWELWNRQKLSPELELKQRCIQKLNQELTNQLIQLERHFNTLELQSFGGNAGFHTDRRALQSRYVPSRHLQSLHSLQNTMSSQLAAAEQLSECLSKQMSLLSVESPVKQKNVKKELFETIGIPYDASFSSPDATKVGDTSSLKKLLLSSGSAATKGKSRRHQSSDSETSRRRRDSLDQSWASFEPTKTTVKRVLLQESQKKNVNKSSLLKDRQRFCPSFGDRSAVHQEDRSSPSSFLHPSESKGLQYGFPKQAFEETQTAPFKWATNPPSPSQPLALRSPTLQRNNAMTISVSSYLVSPPAGEKQTREAYSMTADESKSMLSHIEKFDSVLINETRFIQQTETNLNKKSAVSTTSPVQTSLFSKKPNEIPVSTSSNALGKTAMQSVKPGPTDPKGSFFESPSKNYEHFASLGASPVAPSLPGKVPQINVATSKSQPSEKVSSSPAVSISLSVSSSLLTNISASIPSSISAPTSSAAMPLSTSLTSSKVTTDSNQTVSSTSLSSVSFSPVFASSSSLSFQAPKTVLPSYTPPVISVASKELQRPLGKTPPSSNQTPTRLTSESLKTEIQPLMVKTTPNFNPTPTPSVSESLETAPQPPAGKIPPFVTPTTPSVSEPPETEVPHPSGEVSSKTDVDVLTTAPQPEPPKFGLKLEPLASSVLTTGLSTGLPSGDQPSLNNFGSSASPVALNSQPQQPSARNILFGAPISTSDSASAKNESSDVAVTEEDEMEEEAPESSRTNELNLGNLGGFGIGATPSLTAPRANPFGGPFGSTGSNVASSSLTMTVPSGELFRPASFNFQNPQPSQPSPPTNMGAFSGGFGTVPVAQAPAQSQFGQPAQIGPGQQALGSVLGSFGQSRHFGTGLPGSSFASTSGFGGGFAASSSTGGFASSASAGGFAGVASTGSGFAALASSGAAFTSVAAGGGFGSVASGGGFGGVASGSSGFAGVASGGGGFPAAASSGGGFAAVPASGSGFGAFGGQQGTGGLAAFSGNAGGQQGIGGFPAFSGNPGGTGKPPELFTQMRK